MIIDDYQNMYCTFYTIFPRWLYIQLDSYGISHRQASRRADRWWRHRWLTLWCHCFEHSHNATLAPIHNNGIFWPSPLFLFLGLLEFQSQPHFSSFSSFVAVSQAHLHRCWDLSQNRNNVTSIFKFYLIEFYRKHACPVYKVCVHA